MSKNSEYFKKWYHANKEVQHKRIKDRKNLIKNEVRAYKESNPCVDCGILYHHFVMDFDHIDPNTKTNNISSIINSGSRNKIWEEITKCELVCANCHRARTWTRYSDTLD